MKVANASHNIVDDHRLLSVESLRWIGALMVVFFHITISLYPAMFIGFESGAPVHAQLEFYLFGNPLLGLINGQFAVAIFFALSGFVLSIAFFREQDPQRRQDGVVRQFLKRYWRLTIPALCSVLMAYVLIKMGFAFNHEAYAVTGSFRLHDYWSVTPNLFEAIWQGTVGIYYGENTYNQVLWSMQWELLGSLLVFVLLSVAGSRRFRWFLYAIMFFVTINTFLGAFVIGLVLADLYASKQLPKLNWLQTLCILLIALYLAGYPVMSASQAVLYAPLVNLGGVSYMWYGIGASLVLLTVLANRRIGDFLARPALSRIGQHTFSIYLLHDIVILSACSYLIVNLSGHMPYWAMSAVVVAFLLVALIVPVKLFTKHVDGGAIKFSRWFADITNK